jgi:hypothetical protein
MQVEIDAADTTRSIQILGLNGIGHESGNSAATNGRVLPMLQDIPSQDVWCYWKVTYRDVVILDRENIRVGVFNLTEHSLADSTNFLTLKQMLLDASN